MDGRHYYIERLKFDDRLILMMLSQSQNPNENIMQFMKDRGLVFIWIFALGFILQHLSGKVRDTVIYLSLAGLLPIAFLLGSRWRIHSLILDFIFLSVPIAIAIWIGSKQILLLSAGLTITHLALEHIFMREWPRLSQTNLLFILVNFSVWVFFFKLPFWLNNHFFDLITASRISLVLFAVVFFLFASASLFETGFYQIGINSFRNLYFLISIFSLCATGLYLFLWIRIFRSTLIRFLGILVIVAFLHFIPGWVEDLVGPMPYPSVGPFRFLFAQILLVIILFAEMTFERTQHVGLFKFFILGNIVWLLGSMWSAESAVYCGVTWLPAYTVLVLKSKKLRSRYYTIVWLLCPMILLMSALALYIIQSTRDE
ncbi:MAG: hypothetical protein HY072_02805 [Deltaproteobacteria bacterium]|nr:hypothetical protein [Deltaproteobacteria bacterium]